MVTLFLSDGYFYEWLSRDILIQLLMLLIAFFYVALRIGMLKGIDYLMAINHEKYIEHKNDNFTLLVVMSIGLILSILWINFTFYYCPEVIEFVKSTSLLPETDIFEFLNDFFRVLIMIFYCCIIPYGIVIFCIYLFQKLHHSR